MRLGVIGMGRILGMGLPAIAAHPLKLQETHGDEPSVPGEPLWVLHVASMALVLLGGAFAGLTLA